MSRSRSLAIPSAALAALLLVPPTDAHERAPRIGIEAIDDFEEHHVGAGPLFVYRGTKNLNILGAYIFGLDEREENGDELRLIFEWEF